MKLMLTDLEKGLIDTLTEMEIIDSHEHLLPEKERIEKKVDIFTLFSTYTSGDLLRAGMEESVLQSLVNHDISLDIRWKNFAPYWEKIRWTSYSRAVLLAVQKFYGFNDINEKTYEGISEAMKKSNKQGIYERILRKGCKIRTCLNDQFGNYGTGLKTGLLTPVMRITSLYTDINLTQLTFEPNANINSLDGYLDACKRYILKGKSEGVVGLKIVSNPFGIPNRENAISFFEKLKSGLNDKVYSNSLRDYIVDEIIKFAGEQDLVIAVHTGYWGDFRELHPLHMIPILQRHQKVRFDIYHLGYPWMRETLMLAKGFSNVWLNFCWTYILSQRFGMAGLDEAIDLIPSNKILAFGGDYSINSVEKIYGHLVMARESIVKVLGKRIEEGQMSENQAVNLARKWLWDNPKELYRLNL